MTALADIGGRPGRDEAIIGKNPTVTVIAENIARAARALEDLRARKGQGN